jgi:hypothetical protein
MAQDEWRFCTKCNALFFNGFGPGQGGPTPKGVCPKDRGEHTAQGFNFILDFTPDFDAPDTPTTQSKWRFCHKCNVMFFAGSKPQDRHCARDGGHEEAGFHFVLPINRKGGPVLNPPDQHFNSNQGHWHFCGKCTSLFFNGFPGPDGKQDVSLPANQGVCPAGGPHKRLGDTFVLPIKQLFL